MTLVAGSCVIRAGMVVQLVTVKQEQNTTILKVIEKDGVLKRLLEQLQITYRPLVSSCCLFLLPLEPSVTPYSCLFFRSPGRAGAVSGISRAGRVHPEPGP
jgi:hypothetical protein